MSRSHHSGDQPSQRMLRVGELIRHVVADLLSQGVVNDPVLDDHVISVPEVRMSPDLKLATVFVMPLGGKDVNPVLEALDRNRKFMRSEVAHKCTLRFAPELRFRVDESFDRGSRIDTLLNSPEVQRDLAVLGEDDDEAPQRPH
ncbi:30S ribosome-binding factor RbfA [Lichenihabitans sp. Uapishka_5]|uniref:30S ribosome-binding factor RbfA n=1 Tax=Lichenihabitans sp. Uapishka_5 TaxID=3037302 RepID=UPI0029E81213|nr:30S ribosome-binding factor RbfA [Lichenihabitans sp. Uapishka_5]MDX7953144.1 30S ribosome-binding factor RbfA [Lichenihabitans sp. Uapishka_5]